MQVQFRGYKEGRKINIKMIYPDGHPRTVMMAELPMDGDWRADVDFFDEIETAYKKRLRRALRK